MVINALDTLGLIEADFYDQDTGDWYIQTPSLVLPNSIVRQTGDIVPLDWRSEQ